MTNNGDLNQPDPSRAPPGADKQAGVIQAQIAEAEGPTLPATSSDPLGPDAAAHHEQPPSLTSQTRSGAIWSVGGMVFAQGSTVVAQAVVGRILDTEFALNMVVISVAVIASTLRDAGIRKIAIAQAADFDRVARPLRDLAWVLNLSVALGLIAIAPLLAKYSFDQPQPRLIPMLWVVAATFAISPIGIIQAAKLSIDLRFRSISLLSIGGYLIRNGSLILLALLGYKEMALVLPMFLAMIFDCVFSRLLAGPLPKGDRLTLKFAIRTLLTSRWIMLSFVGIFLAARADSYFILRIGQFETSITAYGFALTLVGSALTPFTFLLQMTLMPVFVRMAGDAERLGNAFRRVLGVASVMGSAAWLPSVLATGPVINLIWGGKWDHVAPTVVILMAALIPKSLQAAALALDEARGRFRSAAWLLLADGLTTVVFAFFGALTRDPLKLAGCVTLHHLLFCVFHVLFVGRRACAYDPAALRRLIVNILVPALLATTSLGLTLLCVRAAEGTYWPDRSWTNLSWSFLSVTIYILLLRVLQPMLFNKTRDLLLRRNPAG